MQLENKFTIAAPIEEAWAALNNPETVAPCFPGATLESYENDSFTGTVKVKLGPISLTYKGKGTYVDRDDAAHKVIIDASGRDSRGNGTANAKVTGTMKADGPDKTEVTMVTDMTITGRPAQFGRGVISDVSDKIIGQFASCLADKLADKGKAEEPAAAASANGAATSPAAGAAAQPAAPKPVAAAPSGPLRSDVDAIDLLDTAGAPVIKRLAPVLGGALVLLIIFLIRRSRSN
ncbi:SRPBCC family protein [Pseudonocardia sp. H11422]|uniref:SRPBCC family protein n=1 Tax=Pseudonocardia sp. H11422 TaxID=2835866 RepID=UPI001BDBF3FB|nr:SRPBCC family protein [Pseudonocardia sp. H11422]